MKCYVAGSKNPWGWPIVEACFANSHKDAKSFMWRNSHRLSHECDGEYIDLKVNRQADADKYLDVSKTDPYLITDPRTLRLMGWQMDDEGQCDSCGLAAMHIEEYEVCGGCGQCGECGHDDDCDNLTTIAEQ